MPLRSVYIGDVKCNAVHNVTCNVAPYLLKGPFRLPISITEIGHRSDFNPLKLVTCPISADREFSIEIGAVADFKFKDLEIVNKTKTMWILFKF